MQSFRTQGQLLKIPPLSAQIYHSLGGRGGSPIFWGVDGKRLITNNSGLPKLLRWSHAFRSDQKSGLPKLLRWSQALRTDRNQVPRLPGTAG